MHQGLRDGVGACLDDGAGSSSARVRVKAEEAFANWTRQIPAGRTGTPEKPAAVDGTVMRSLL